MQLIYKAGDIIEAHIIAGLLEANNIDTHVGGYYLQGGVGDLATMDFVTIHVADENVDSATKIITEYEEVNTQKTQESDKDTNIFVISFIVLVISLLMMLVLAIAFGNL